MGNYLGLSKGDRSVEVTVIVRWTSTEVPLCIDTTTGELSSKFDEFLPGGRNSTVIMTSIFLCLHLANPRPLCDRFLRFIVLCFLRKKNNVAFRHRRNVYAARLMDLRNR